MKDSFCDESAIIKNSAIRKAKIYRNVYVLNSEMGDGCSIGDDTTIERCRFENNVVINRRSYINDSEIGMYSYAGINTTMNWTRLGRFCSLGRNVDIGGFDHDYHKITTLPSFRFEQMSAGGGKLKRGIQEEGTYCQIGNDVWIAAGAQILHNVTIGDGAVIGAGAVVTHDVPPYAVVVGVPARVISYRCKEEHIEELLKIKWWNWPIEIIMENMEYFIQNDIADETIQMMKKISSDLRSR